MNFPQPFIRQMQALLGKDVAAFIDALQAESPVSIRLNPQKRFLNNTSGSKHEVAENVGWSQYGYYLTERPIFTLDPLFHAGTYYVQEAASMFVEQAVEQLLDSKENLNILDLCAAPGGKSTHLLSLFSDSCLLVANEAIRGRAGILRENICKWGFPNSIVTNNSAKDFSRLPDYFDVMLVDAPCSGEGMFRKDRDAVGEWSEANVALCAERQRKILADAWLSLKAGGLLMYSTCTYNRRENEESIQWLANELGAESLRIQLKDEWGVVESIEANTYSYRFFPHQTKSEGFFMAALRKTEEFEQSVSRKLKNKTQNGVSRGMESFRHLLNSGDKWQLMQWNNMLKAMPIDKLTDMLAVEQQLNIISSGINVGELKGKGFIPSAPLALSIALNTNAYPAVNVDLETAQRYLRRDPIVIGNAAKGYLLVCYENTPLGWLKNLGNRSNNLYPSEWRIRMELR